MKTAFLIAIGSELTLGQTVDTNSAWLARRLAALGIVSVGHGTAPDDFASIVDLIRHAAGKAALVLITGGLGPTDDDLTRAAIAEAAGVTLRTDPALVTQLQAFFTARKREMPERNHVQAQLPVGASALPNSCGTAPGVRMLLGAATLYALPGVPYEMRTMFDVSVAPELAKLAGGSVILTREIHTFGRPEAEVNDLLGDLMKRGRNPDVGTSAAHAEIAVKIHARAASAAAATKMLDETEQQVRTRLTWAVFGRDNDSLAAAVGRELLTRGATLAVAESCTGGLLGEMITSVPGSSAYFLGGVIAYADRLKVDFAGVDPASIVRCGAVSAPIAEALAAGIRERTGATYALSITGIAGPAGGSSEKPVGLAFVGLATAEGATSRELRIGPDQPRDVIRARAANAALQILRRRLLGLESSA